MRKLALVVVVIIALWAGFPVPRGEAEPYRPVPHVGDTVSSQVFGLDSFTIEGTDQDMTCATPVNQTDYVKPGAAKTDDNALYIVIRPADNNNHRGIIAAFDTTNTSLLVWAGVLDGQTIQEIYLGTTIEQKYPAPCLILYPQST